jgi:hypothetical protein
MVSEGIDGPKGTWGYFFSSNYLFIYLSTFLSTFLSIFLIYLSLWLFICLFIYLSFFCFLFYLSSSLPVYLCHSVKQCNVEWCSIQFSVVKYSEVWYIVILQCDIWTSKKGLISLIIIFIFRYPNFYQWY